MQIELELLAPAKNREIGIAAVDCGADALYMAGPEFGAREAAGNAMEEVARTVEYARRFGVKVYLTLNTILYENELPAARKMVYDAYEAGCDAVIVQDMALLKMELPPIRLFASTQANISTVERACLLRDLGFDRLILARELSLEQIAMIKRATGMDIECFVHGALCVSYSGQCYLSEYLTGRSANRGCCAQVCRSLYTLADASGRVYARNQPLLSLRDLNLSRRIPDLIRAGVTSFKIEGRLKNSSYVKNSVRLYRSAIDSFIAENPGYARASAGSPCGGFVPDAALTFNRGFTEYFIDGRRGKWSSATAAKYIGERVGKVTSSGKSPGGTLWFEYDREKGAAPVVNGDGLCFVQKNGEIAGLRANSCSANRVVTTEEMTVCPGTPIYRNFNFAFERELEKNMPRRLVEVALEIEAAASGKLLVKAMPERGGLLEMEFEASFPPASNRTLALENITRQFGKTSGIFSFKVVKSSFPGEVPFIPLSRLNGMRHDLARAISETAGRKRRNTSAPPRSCVSVPKLSEINLTYLANCSNSLSRELYAGCGAKEIAPAYELEHKSGVELMRTKYCIRYELGFCYKADPERAKQIQEPLWLINGGKRLKLSFDCRRCQMFVIG